MNHDEFQAALDGCVRCGRCLSVCPIYKLTVYEGSAARGKLSLLRAELGGEADLAGRMKDLLSYCLLCGACAESCAGGVRGDDLIKEGRFLAVRQSGTARLQGLLSKDLLARGALVRTLWKGRSLFLKDVPKESGLHFRFPVPGFDKRRWLPQPAKETFLNSLKKNKRDLSQSPESGPRIALFVGCVSNYLRPESAESGIALLKAAGARVVIPEGQVCCGKPAAGAGDEGTADYLARRNIKAFDPSEFDYITTFCATCSEQLKEYGHNQKLKGGNSLAEKVRDFNDLLANVLNWFPPKDLNPPTGEELKVFYHDPCHLRRKQGIYREPRSLLEALPGIKLVGADQDPACCGYGGIFNLWHYDLSRDIFNVRTDGISPHSPDMVVTSCSGCWLQFEDQARALGAGYKVKPLVELLAEKGLAGRE